MITTITITNKYYNRVGVATLELTINEPSPKLAAVMTSIFQIFSTCLAIEVVKKDLLCTCYPINLESAITLRYCLSKVKMVQESQKYSESAF